MDGISRRSALLAAAAASMSATELLADGQTPGEGKKPLLLRIVLPDGQAIDIKASEVKIDFGTSAKLLVTPSGVLPAFDPVAQPSPSNDFLNPSTAPRPRSRPATGVDPLDRLVPEPDPFNPQ